jgi:hypothetical protein
MIWSMVFTEKLNKLRDIERDLEKEIEERVASRHEYPIWPSHGGQLDAFEQEFYVPPRHTYYSSTILLIRFLRELRKVTERGLNS